MKHSSWGTEEYLRVCEGQGALRGGGSLEGWDALNEQNFHGFWRADVPEPHQNSIREEWLRALKAAIVVPVGTETGPFYVFPYILPSTPSCTPCASGEGWAGTGAVLAIWIIMSSKVPTRPFQSLHVPSFTSWPHSDWHLLFPKQKHSQNSEIF